MTSQDTVLAPVYPSIGYEELGRLLREAGYDIEPVADQDRPTYRMLSEPRFMIRLLGALEERPADYHSISVWARLAVSPDVLAKVLRRAKSQNMFALLHVDQSGQLVVTQDILVGGGVTAHHLKHQIAFWRNDLKRVLDVVRDSQGALAGRTLN